MDTKAPEVVYGRLHFHSETGTEGGYWALQDNEHINIERSEWGLFARTRVWTPDHSRQGTVLTSFHQDGRILPDPLGQDPDYPESTHFQGPNGPDPEGKRAAADERLIHRWGERARPQVKKAKEGEAGYDEGHSYLTGTGSYGVTVGDVTVCIVSWDDGEPKDATFERSDELHVERWSYEGLNILKTGDSLQIFAAGTDPEKDPEIDVEWEGEVKLNDVPLFTEHANGMWIHADQEGVDRDQWAQWFFEDRPARLRVA